jgi:hypothetical protein
VSAFDPVEVRGRLDAMQSREEAAAYVAGLGLRKAELGQLASQIDVSTDYRQNTIAKLQRRIVDVRVGDRLDFEAMGRWRDGIVEAAAAMPSAVELAPDATTPRTRTDTNTAAPSHLRPAPDSLSLTETSATWRNARGHSFVAERLPLPGEAGYVKGTEPGDWEIYRVSVVEACGVLDYGTHMAIKDADVITVGELTAILGRDPELTATSTPSCAAELDVTLAPSTPEPQATAGRAVPGLGAAAGRPASSQSTTDPLGQSDPVANVRVWASALPHTETDAYAAEAMARTEENLRATHPAAMAHYDSHRAAGAAPTDAMMAAAPVFDEPQAVPDPEPLGGAAEAELMTRLGEGVASPERLAAAGVTGESLAKAQALLVSQGHSMKAIADGWGIDARTSASAALHSTTGAPRGTTNLLVTCLSYAHQPHRGAMQAAIAATPGLAAAANQAPQPRTSKPAPAPAQVVGKTLRRKP